jgi:hypothetical protein
VYLVHDLVAKGWPLSDKNNLQSKRLKESATVLDDKTVIKLFPRAGAAEKRHHEGAESSLAAAHAPGWCGLWGGLRPVDKALWVACAITVLQRRRP